MSQARSPRGVPSGGQFSTVTRPEPSIAIAAGGAGNDRESEQIYVMPVEDFIERFDPAEYDFNQGWWGVEDNENFWLPNPFNPDRIHSGIWDEFLVDVGENGITNPVVLDPYDETLVEGHHRVIAAWKTGQPVRFVWGDPPVGTEVPTIEGALAEQVGHKSLPVWSPPTGLETQEGSFDRCKQTSAVYTNFLRRQGFDADWVQVAGPNRPFPTADKRWLGLRQESWSHYITRVNNADGSSSYVDWTMRQFDPEAPFPTVTLDVADWSNSYTISDQALYNLLRGLPG